MCNSKVFHIIVALVPCRTIDRSPCQEIIDRWVNFITLDAIPMPSCKRILNAACVVQQFLFFLPAGLAVNRSSCLAKTSETKNTFHHMRIDKWLARSLCLLCVTAKDLGMIERKLENRAA